MRPARSALAKARAQLLAARASRVRPGWDDKVLVDWNGLMIAALAEAAMAFERPDWLELAARAFRFIRTSMMKDGRLFHAWRAGKLQHAATLDDHAHLATRGAGAARGDRRGALSRGGAGAGGAARRAFLGPSGGRLFHDRRRREGRDPAPEIRRRQRDAQRQRRHGRRAGAALSPDRRADAISTARRRWSRRSRASSGATSSRSPPCINSSEFLENAVQIVVVGAARRPGDPGT